MISILAAICMLREVVDLRDLEHAIELLVLFLHSLEEVKNGSLKVVTFNA